MRKNYNFIHMSDVEAAKLATNDERHATENIQVMSDVNHKIELHTAMERNCGSTMKILVNPNNAPASSGLVEIVYSDKRTKGIHIVIAQLNPNPLMRSAPTRYVILSKYDTTTNIAVITLKIACDIVHIIRIERFLLDSTYAMLNANGTNMDATNAITEKNIIPADEARIFSSNVQVGHSSSTSLTSQAEL